MVNWAYIATMKMCALAGTGLYETKLNKTDCVKICSLQILPFVL